MAVMSTFLSFDRLRPSVVSRQDQGDLSAVDRSIHGAYMALRGENKPVSVRRFTLAWVIFLTRTVAKTHGVKTYDMIDCCISVFSIVPRQLEEKITCAGSPVFPVKAQSSAS